MARSTGVADQIDHARLGQQVADRLHPLVRQARIFRGEIHRHRVFGRGGEDAFVPLVVKHLAAGDGRQIGVQLGLQLDLAHLVAVADLLRLVAVMPGDPAAVLGDVQMVEILHLLEGRDPDLRMLAQHLGQPAGPGLLRADAQRAGLAGLALGIEGRADRQRGDQARQASALKCSPKVIIARLVHRHGHNIAR